MDWDVPPEAAEKARTGIEQAARGTPVEAVMTTPIRCVVASASLTEVRADLVLGARGALAVVDDDGAAIGVITKTDVLRAERLGSARVDDAMSPFVISVRSGEPVAHAISRMSHENVHHIIVLGEGHRPVGVVSTLDVLHWMTARLGLSFAATS